jgi:hypothetical protein
MTAIVSEKLKKVSNCTDSSVRVLSSVQVFGLYIDSDDSIIYFKAEIEDRTSAREINGKKSTP